MTADTGNKNPADNLSAPAKRHLEQPGTAGCAQQEAIIIAHGNDASQPPDITGFNHAASAILGPVLEPGTPLLIDRFIPGKAGDQISQAIRDTLSHGSANRNIQATVLRASGRHVPMTVSVEPLYTDHQTLPGVLLTVYPETQAQSGSEPFKTSARALMEHLPEGVFIVNTRWQIAFFNRAAEKITGYQRQQVLGRYCWEIFQSDLCELGCPLKTTLETGSPGVQQTVRILTANREPQTMLVNTAVLKDDRGSIAGAVETFRPLPAAWQSSAGAKISQSSSRIIGKSKAIRHLFSILEDVCQSQANVFITGDSGTGKELFARTIHENSARAGHPFMAVNCSALAETLLESELFGHEKFAFTGAVKSRPGRFERVKQGTLFLDEIGDLKPGLQVKLLRVLEQREFERVGGTCPIPLEARIICATNRDLSQALADGSFRKDFYYRLRTVPLTIPPLRDRREDIPLLVDFFIRAFNRSFKKKVTGVSPEVMALFCDYHWPGNVRELERTIEHAFVFVKGPLIHLDNLPAQNMLSPKPALKTTGGRRIELTRKQIYEALDQAGGKKDKAAQRLGISRTSLWRKLKAYHTSR